MNTSQIAKSPLLQRAEFELEKRKYLVRSILAAVALILIVAALEQAATGSAFSSIQVCRGVSA